MRIKLSGDTTCDSVTSRLLADAESNTRIARAAERIIARRGGAVPHTVELTAELIEVPRNDGDTVLVMLVDEAALPDAEAVATATALTLREAEVALQIAQGKSNKLVARELNVTVYTVRRHCERILRKLQLGSRRDVRLALMTRHPDA